MTWLALHPSCVTGPGIQESIRWCFVPLSKFAIPFVSKTKWSWRDPIVLPVCGGCRRLVQNNLSLHLLSVQPRSYRQKVERQLLKQTTLSVDMISSVVGPFIWNDRENDMLKFCGTTGDAKFEFVQLFILRPERKCSYRFPSQPYVVNLEK